MAAEAKALLDELMGRSRNLDPSDQPADLKWGDDDVCKYFLCGFCPHELFTNTRADLDRHYGPCTKIHDEALRKDYQGNPRFEKCGYEEDFMRFLNTLINDVEKRIRRGHQRLALNNQQAAMNGTPGNMNNEKTVMLTERINDLVVQAEELGCEGKVEEAQGVMKLVDQLKEERQQQELRPMQDDGGPLMKQMEVCDVCGAFLIVGDAPQRQDEHLMGKQHAGYAQVRAEIERRKQKVRDETEAREANENKMRLEREEREKERLREREERRNIRDKDTDKRRDRDRGDKRRRSRSRSRDRGKDRRRSRSRERRRQRSSSKDRRSRRSRSRNRDSRKRSSSRGKRSSRRSSSRDRKRDHRHSKDTSSRSSARSRSRDRKDRSREKESERNGSGREDDSRHGSSKEGESRGNSRDKTTSRGDSTEQDHTSKDIVSESGDPGTVEQAANPDPDMPSLTEEPQPVAAMKDEGPDPDSQAALALNCEGDSKMDE